MRQLSVIPCGIKKIWDKQPEIGAVRAEEAYIGTFHCLCQAYAEKFTNDWVVLSAKYGFLRPDDCVDGPYDITFGQKHQVIISNDQLQTQVKEKQLDHYDELIVLTGKKYKKVIEDSFGANFPVQYPLLGYKGIGYMQQALSNSVQSEICIHKLSS